MQSNCSKKEKITVREQIIGGKKYIIVSHYTGNKNFKEIICNHAFKRTLEETNTSSS